MRHADLALFAARSAGGAVAHFEPAMQEEADARQQSLLAGFADALVPSDRLTDLCDALLTRADPATPAELVLRFDETPAPSRLAAARPWIDDAFSADTVAEIVARMHRAAT